MSKQYDNTNRGVLFRNDRKEGDKDRDYNGTINVDNTEYWLSAWINKSKDGKSYMSLSVKPKDEKPKDEKPKKPADEKPELDDDIPF